jgi:membrane protein YdbS with pleckstrin-like domain
VTLSYVDDELLPGETVEFRTGRHPFLAWGPSVPFVAVGVLAILKILVEGVQNSDDLGVSIMWFMIAGVIFLIGNAFVRSGEFAVTTHRIIARVGVLSVTSVEINLAKVEGLQVTQNPLGQLVGFGTVIVTGTGGTHEPFTGIRDPQALRRAVQQRLTPAA